MFKSNPLCFFAGDRHWNQRGVIHRLRWGIETSFRYLKHVNGIARKYFWRDSRTEKDIIHLMIKYVHAVKEELRQFSRPLRGIGAVHFAFR